MPYLLNYYSLFINFVGLTFLNYNFYLFYNKLLNFIN